MTLEGNEIVVMSLLFDLLSACDEEALGVVKAEKSPLDVLFAAIMEVAKKAFDKPFVRGFVYHMFYMLHSNVPVWVSMNRCAIKSLVSLLEEVAMGGVCDVCKMILMIINNESACWREM